MSTAATVNAALSQCAERLNTRVQDLSPLLHCSIGFVVPGHAGWALRVESGSVRLELGVEDVDVVMRASSFAVLHAIVLDASKMIAAHQAGDLELDDDTLAPVIHRLLEAPWQSEARQMRVLSRMGAWGRVG